MNREIEFALEEFSNDSERLKEGSEVANSQLEKDGVVQRFEFTFELLWKLLKVVLEQEGYICQSPKSCISLAHKMGYLSDTIVYERMLSDRNKLSHIYSELYSAEIYERIKSQYVKFILDFRKDISAKVSK